MKEIKAYVRMNMARARRARARRAGLPRLLDRSRCAASSAGLPRGSYDFSVTLGEAFEPMLKFEVVCRDENAERLVEAIRKAATTGQPGDGRIFVGTVDEAVAISSGNRGEGVLTGVTWIFTMPITPMERLVATPKDAHPRRQRLVLGAVAVASLVGFVLAGRDWPRESDRHAVTAEVRELERRIRSRGPDLWLLVEGNDSQDDADADRETRHQAMLRDFERLSHVAGLAITDIVVHVDGDRALATYRIRSLPTEERVPRGGQLDFIRRKDRWTIAGHRFTE